MRVLHVLDAGDFRENPEGDGLVPDGAADDAALVCGALLAHPDLAEHRALVLGPRWFARRAASLGLRVDWAFSPAASVPALGWREIRAAAAASGAAAVCCWSAASERAATLALGRAMPLLRMVLEGAGDAAPRLGAVRREVLEVQSIDPPVFAGPGLRSDRAGIRRQLELGPSDAAVLLIGNRAEASAVRFEFALGLSRHTGTKVVGVLPAWADSFPRAVAFQAKVRHTVRLVGSMRPRREVLQAVDLAVWVGGGRSTTWPAEGRPSRLHVAECLAAGVPVVVPARFGVDDLLPAEARERLIAEVPNPPEIARRLIPLVENAEMRSEVGAACAASWRGKDGVGVLAARLEEAAVRVTRTGGWADVVTQQVALSVT